MLTSISPKPCLARCSLSNANVPSAVMSGTSRMSILATARCGRTVLPPGPVYPATRPSMLMVGCDSSAIIASTHCLSPAQCSTPSCCFMMASLRRRERLRLVEEARHGRCVTVRHDQGIEGLHQVPRRTVHACFQAGVNIMLRTAPPFLAGGDQFQLNDSFGAEIDLDVAVCPLCC